MQIGPIEILPKRPALMGILNVTPDSFSDGGRYVKFEDALRRALELEEEGAAIIDIGGESTRPGSLPVEEDVELARVIPVIEAIRKRTQIPISIDTQKSSVAVKAVESGANLINDISAGLYDPAMLHTAAKLSVPICLMHMQGRPETMQERPLYDDLISEIYAFFEGRIAAAVSAGIKMDMILIDPGICFGKSVQNNIEILNRLDELLTLNAPILIGTSRKSFIGKLLGLDVADRDEATLATLACAAEKGASIMRVHDVAAANRFLSMYLHFV